VEECVAAFLNIGQQLGAELLSGTEVLGWTTGDSISVRTSAGDFQAERLIITAGAWASRMLGSLDVPLEVRRKPLMWFGSDNPRTRADAGFPCYLFELPSGVFYGFPEIDDRGLKAAEHSGGETVADPLRVDRTLREADSAPVERFLHAHLPAAQTPCREYAVCMYTMSPDEHFILDRHPHDPRVVFAAGLSGHGFKFTPVLGKALADLAADGATNLPIEFLSLNRLAATR
jgi:glycine/D-amino acid oxidase-like deaminating enzyme